MSIRSRCLWVIVNKLIADVAKANLLPRRPMLPLYADRGLIQYL